MLEQIDRLHEENLKTRGTVGPCGDGRELHKALRDARSHALQSGGDVCGSARDDGASGDRNYAGGREQVATRIGCGVRSRRTHRP